MIAYTLTSLARLRSVLRPAHLGALLALLLPLAQALPLQGQILDLNANGISDVWETLYGMEGTYPDADNDHDGVPNRLEAIAGTDPCNSNSLPRISGIRATTNGVEVTVAGIIGKRYLLEGAERVDVANPPWALVDSAVATATGPVVFTTPADKPALFFRFKVEDVDSDFDGLSDWEEAQLGLDPQSATSNGHLDATGKPLNDYQYLRNRMSFETLASILATRANLVANSQSGDPMVAADIAAGSGLTGNYYTNSSPTYTNEINFNSTNLFLTTNNAVIDFNWGPALNPNLSNALATVRWTGQIQPQYSELYVFETRSDEGVKLWVNDQLLVDRWQLQGTTSWTNAIRLQSGVRYNIRLEYFNRGGNARMSLYWYSPSQARQIIPANRLYPSSDGLQPGAITSPLTAVGFLGQPFTYTITGANTPLGYDATNLPPGLSFDSTNGVISGIPTLAGAFQVPLTVSNVVGTSSALLDLQIIDSGSSVTREIWTAVPGTSVTNIPVHLPASLTNTLGTLEGVANYGDNYGERVRGYLVAPVSGNYYFWLAANSAAELWISNDEEPANRVRRVTVTKPTLPRQWNGQPGQRSSWLALEAGQRYYIEILHKAGKGAGDHWAVGWAQDSYGTNLAPTGIVPGFLLSNYVAAAAAPIPGTLYSANLVAVSGVTSSGIGSATVRLSADGTLAVLRYASNGLSSPVTSRLVESDPYLGKASQILFDIDQAEPQQDGTYLWDIIPVGPLSANDVREIIREGKSYLTLGTVNFPNGEISGHFALAEGTPTFTPPPLAPAWKDDHTSSNAAARFLLQATFGPSPADIVLVRSAGYSGWLTRQFAMKPSLHLTNVLALGATDPNLSYPGTLSFNTWWQQSLTAPDQLRQRVAFALSEILVVSESGPLSDNSRALSAYYDILLRGAFGNFRTLLRDVTLSPTMGVYLDMRRNDKGNIITGTHPNENYAREIMQLFSIGLNRMWPDGTLVLNSAGDVVPTYNQDVIIGLAKVFTGWTYWQTNQANKRLPVNWNPAANYSNAMVLVPTHHELVTKRILDNVVLPAALGTQADSANTNFDAYCSRDLELALDNIFQNQNVGPFLCRQLIQRLVASHPSRDYLYRVVQKFNDNGAGVRGDLKAVIQAILLDYEARSPVTLASPTFGKQREPLLRATSIARALPAPAPVHASYKQSGSQVITVTTSKPHRLSSSDDVFLAFTGTPAPINGLYNNVAVNGPNTFTLTAAGVSVCSYGQAGNAITVTNSGHGLNAGNQIYLTFTSGGAISGVHTVAAVTSSSVFTVTNSHPGTRAGAAFFPKWTGGSFVQSGSNITVVTVGAHGLTVGKNVYINFPAGTESPDTTYRVATVAAPNRFTVFSSVSTNRYNSDPIVLPLVAAPITRSGSVTIRYSTYAMNYTDGGSSSSLSQTPLNPPTVFNYFYPDFKYQGILAAAGLTTPEFQLTSDTSVVLQMNFLSSGIFNNSANTNGLSSFASGNGSVTMDIGPWMTAARTSDAGIPGLVDSLNTLLCAGQLSAEAKAVLVGYVANTTRFPYSTVPTAAQMRDRVRAVVHLIMTSPDFIVQR